MIRQDLSYEIGGPKKGYIEYDDKQRPPVVLFNVVLKGNAFAAQAIRNYLTSKRTFSLPMSNVEDNGYIEETHVPTANILLFEQALQELGSRFGIFLA